MMSVVDKPVEDGIGERGIGHRLVPVISRELAGDNGGTMLMPVVSAPLLRCGAQSGSRFWCCGAHLDSTFDPVSNGSHESVARSLCEECGRVVSGRGRMLAPLPIVQPGVSSARAISCGA